MILMQQKCSRNIGRKSKDTETLEQSKNSLMPISSVEVSLAKTSATQAKGRASRVNGPDSGKNSSESFAWLDPNTSSWKTFQRSLVEGWISFSGILPRAGMMRNGRLYRRAPLVHHIHDKGCFLWPTPTREDWRGGGKNCNQGYFKHRVARRFGGTWPHPTFVEQVMGFPIGWTESSASAMPSSPKSRNSSAV